MNQITKIALALTISIGLFSCATNRTAHFKNNRFQKRALEKVETATIIEEVTTEEEVAKEEEVITASKDEKLEEVSTTNETFNEVADKSEEKEKLENLKEEVANYKLKTRKEKKEIRKELKEVLKNEKYNLDASGSGLGEKDTNNVILIIFALLLPPLAVFLVKGISKEFWISLLLILLWYFGAFAHLVNIAYALYVILTR